MAGPPQQPSPDPRSLNVVRAAYGPNDVTDKVKSLIKAQSLDLVATNSTFGDSWSGVAKSFTLTYRWGSAAYQSLAAAEGAVVSVHQPPTPYLQDIISLEGLIAEGDLIALKAGNGNYVAPDAATGQLLANVAARVPETAFTARPDPSQPAQLTLADSGNRPVIVDPSTGTLRVAQDSSAPPAKLLFSLIRSGSITIGVVGSTRNFSALQADNSILAGGADITTFNTSFTFELNPSAEGLQNHLRLYGVSEAELPSPELLKVVWDLTGGFFLAIGLGPLLAGSNVPAPGIYNLIRSNARASAALDALIAAALANRESVLSTVFLFSFIGVLWDTDLMWQIFRMAVSAGAWWLLGWAAAKLLEWTILPEAAAAELVVSFARWAYTTTTDVLAYANSANGSAELLGAAPEIPVPAA